MVGACLVPLMTLVLAISPDAASLVARLGSGTLAEREESARALEAMGREALPALEAALRSPDAEVRSRVLSVWERIQKGLLVRPSMVRIEGEGRPLAEVVRSIGEQGGFSLEISQQGPERLINAREPAPDPVLGGGRPARPGRRPTSTISNPGGGHFPTLDFGGSEDACPSTISGPFRITLKGLHDHRDRSLIVGPWLRIDRDESEDPDPPDGQGARGPVLHRPRDDDRASDVVHPGRPGPGDRGGRRTRPVSRPTRHDPSRGGSFPLYNGGGVTQGQVQLDLAMPDKPGRSIVRLRGSIPVAIQVRRPVPALEIPLPAARGKAFAHEDAVFTLREFREDDQGTGIIVDVRINLDRFELPAGRDRRDRLVPATVPVGPPGRDRRCRWQGADRVRRGRFEPGRERPG